MTPIENNSWLAVFDPEYSDVASEMSNMLWLPNPDHNDEKRPLFIACGHSLCSKCLRKFPECPICNKKWNKPRTILLVLSMKVLRVDEPESCSSCYESSTKLRLCITCELALDHLYLETRRNDGSPWDDYGQYEEFLRKNCKNFIGIKMVISVLTGNMSSIYRQPFDKATTRLRFRTLFHYLSNRMFCSDCILNDHEGHVVKTLKELEYSEKELKQPSSFIASTFLWNTLKEREAKCLLRKMKMLRICEQLKHLAVFWYPNPSKSVERQEKEISKPSEVNKFFDPMDFENGKNITLEEGEKLISRLEEAFELLNANENCQCQEIWDEMHRRNFGNQIEKYFLDVVNRGKNTASSECSISCSEISEMRTKAQQMSKTKLFTIYTAFCWSYENVKLCGMFNNHDRKPCICTHCNVSACQDCLRSFSRRCSFCGRSFFDYGKNRVYNFDSGVLELINCYQNNCYELFEKWWKCDASELQFCLSCSSYSDQLEVCVFCELNRSKQKSALTTKPIRMGSSTYRQDMKLHFQFDGLALLPMRWQCAHCKSRLEADWIHKNCKDPKYDDWKGTWNRGCNHLINRVYDRKRCCSYNARADYHEYNAILLKDIDGYPIAMKVATMGLVLRILKAEIVDKVHCKLQKIRMLNIYGGLNGQVYYYFKNSLYGKRPEQVNGAALKIPSLIENLKKEWNNYKSNAPENCDCIRIWNDADYFLKEKLKKVAVDSCPLHVNHEITIGLSMNTA